MNVDKFGRHETLLSRDVLRGPKGEGFRLTHDGNYDMKKKRLCNVDDAVEESDSVNFKVLQSRALIFDSTQGVFNAQSKRITNVATAVADSDAANRQYVQREIEKLKLELETAIKALVTNFSPSTKAPVDTSSVDKGK